MTTATHQLESVTAMWQGSSEDSDPGLADTLTLSLVCQCGVTTVWSWKYDAAFAPLMVDLALGLTRQVSLAGGRLVKAPHLQPYSSDWHMS